MNFFFAYFLEYSFAILPLPRAVPGKVNSAVCDQNTANQGIVHVDLKLENNAVNNEDAHL